MQLATLGILLDRGYAGRELMLEALLRRGFLAFEDEDGVQLAVGSTDGDVETLSAIVGHELLTPTHPAARARMPDLEGGELSSVVKEIVCVPEHRRGMTAMHTHHSWRHYRNRRWGRKVSVGPDSSHGGLDLGIALLVKTLPLARVSTALSCDGHGETSARIVFASGWDAVWCEEVLRALGDGELGWLWERDAVDIPLLVEADDLSPMLDQVQRVARRLFDPDTSRMLGERRQVVLDELRSQPSRRVFRDQSRLALENMA